MIRTIEEEKLLESLTLAGTTKETFFLLYSRLLEVSCGATDLEFVADGVLSAKGRNGVPMTIYLDNLWLLVRGGQEGGRQAIERYLEAFGTATLQVPVDLDHVLPAIRDERYLQLVQDREGLACRHLAADLWVVYVADSPTSIRTLRWEQIDQMQVERDDLEGLALGNLGEVLTEVNCYGDGPSYLLTAGADYSSSLLLVDEVWESLAEQVEGDIVAVTPSRDVVLFTGTGSADGLAELRQKSLEVFSAANHRISATLLRRVSGGWKAFD